MKPTINAPIHEQVRFRAHSDMNKSKGLNLIGKHQTLQPQNTFDQMLPGGSAGLAQKFMNEPQNSFGNRGGSVGAPASGLNSTLSQFQKRS